MATAAVNDVVVVSAVVAAVVGRRRNSSNNSNNTMLLVGTLIFINSFVYKIDPCVTPTSTVMSHIYPILYQFHCDIRILILIC